MSYSLKVRVYAHGVLVTSTNKPGAQIATGSPGQGGFDGPNDIGADGWATMTTTDPNGAAAFVWAAPGTNMHLVTPPSNSGGFLAGASGGDVSLVYECDPGHFYDASNVTCDLLTDPTSGGGGSGDCSACSTWTLEDRDILPVMMDIPVPNRDAFSNRREVEDWGPLEADLRARLQGLNPPSAVVVGHFEWLGNPFVGVEPLQGVATVTDGSATGAQLAEVNLNVLKLATMVATIAERQHGQGQWANELTTALYERLSMIHQLLELLFAMLGGTGSHDFIEIESRNAVLRGYREAP